MDLSQNEINQIEQELSYFIANLPPKKKPNMLYTKNMERLGGARLTPEMNRVAEEQAKMLFLNNLGDFLKRLKSQEKWLAIKLLLLLNHQLRYRELNLVWRLASMNRWDEISRFYELLKQNRWSDIQTVCDLECLGKWDEVTIRLVEMTTSPESRNLFNEYMLTGELKDMYQYYLTLRKNNQMDEANRLYNKIADILESRAKKLNAAQIDVLKAKELCLPSQTSSQDIESTSSEKLSKLFFAECEKRFIGENHLICGETPGDDGKYPIYIWEKKFCYYRRVENLTELYSRLKKLSRSISLEMGYDTQALLTDQKTKEIVDNLIYSTELTIEKKGLKQSREEQVFFRNGYYDLREGQFYRTTTIDYFHLFCLPYDYDDNAGEPEIFDTMLANMFDSDDRKIELSYQIIGAILSDVTRLKSLFVFKGVPHGGKSTLGDLIASFLAENTVESFPNMDSIEKTKIKHYERNRKLLYIDDAPDKVWSSSTVSYLKSRSRGLSGTNAVVFKILFCTNYAISCNTEEDKRSLQTRLVVLPFNKDMKEFSKNYDNSKKIQQMIRCHFEAERQAIVKKALEKFKVVLNRDGEFTELYDDMSDAIRTSSSQVTSRSNSTVNSCYVPENTTRQTISDKNEDLCNLIRQNYERTEDPESFTTATEIWDFITENMPNTSGRVEDVGKVVKAVFVEGYTTTRRNNGKTCYKIVRIDSQK